MPWWVMAGTGVVVVIAAGLWWQLPKWQANLLRLQITDAKQRADVEDNFRKAIGQLLGGAAVLIGAGFAYYQTQLTLQASHDQINASHDQIISQQVSKGFELLGQQGDDKIVVRLGGIYALEGVMKTFEQYYQPVLEALCAFVRDGTKSETGHGPPATDIQATLTVIGRREGGTGDVDLSSVHIPKVRLFDANLSGANLSGANLNGANLSNANLRGANLSGANLSRANLHTADLRGAGLIGTDLSHADLHGANLSGVGLIGADLSHADLNDADLRRADLSDAIVAQSQLNKTCSDEGTKLPLGLALKPCYR